jgi:hypothetical protein
MDRGNVIVLFFYDLWMAISVVPDQSPITRQWNDPKTIGYSLQCVKNK